MSRVLTAVWLVSWIYGLNAVLPAASAHDFLAGCIQHRVEITVGAHHLDVTVELTFFEDGSEHERGDMDLNQDGSVNREEEAAYLKELEPVLSKAVTLQINGRPVTLITLYPAELDLLGNVRVGRGRHQLTLHYFARTPSELASGAELVVEDRLWRDVRALGSLQVQGKDGCRLEPLPLSDALFAPARDQEVRDFKARVVARPLPSTKSSTDTRKRKS
jgi:hypothetical protein